MKQQGAEGPGMGGASAVRLVPWGEHDLPLLALILGDPAMMAHLGGPESPEKIAERQARYVQMTDPRAGRMFKIVDATTGKAVGSVGYWERDWRGESVYETGWFVLPQFQGRGIAATATAQALDAARSAGQHRFIYAFPGVANPPSNALCRKLGFTLLEECEFEYPRGSFMRCNVWRRDLLSR